MSKQNKKPLALIDLDGTVADYDAAMKRDMTLLASPEELSQLDAFMLGNWENIPHLKARMDLIKRQSNWWVDLAEIPDGMELCARLEKAGFKLNVLSRGPKNTATAWGQKVEWVRKHLPTADITLSLNKSIVRGALLVDDWIPYVSPWLKVNQSGFVLMPDRPWNQNFAHDRCVRYSAQNTVPTDHPFLTAILESHKDHQ